jgi:predicted RNA-binding protein associated with RNAse of E/G family
VNRRAAGLAPGLPVAIDYGRVGGGSVTYRQHLVHAGAEAIVTLQDATPIDAPKRIGGEVVLEPGSPVVWFTFEGAWHDIGSFHLADGTFTGLYANVLTPVDLLAPAADEWRWSTMDLCLDVWRGHRSVQILDQHELEAALRLGSLDDDLASRAREEASRIERLARNDEWPPAVVGEWPLERARSVLRGVDRG